MGVEWCDLVWVERLEYMLPDHALDAISADYKGCGSRISVSDMQHHLIFLLVHLDQVLVELDTFRRDETGQNFQQFSAMGLCILT
jgi:hypothetical protein